MRINRFDRVFLVSCLVVFVLGYAFFSEAKPPETQEDNPEEKIDIVCLHGPSMEFTHPYKQVGLDELSISIFDVNEQSALLQFDRQDHSLIADGGLMAAGRYQCSVNERLLSCIHEKELDQMQINFATGIGFAAYSEVVDGLTSVEVTPTQCRAVLEFNDSESSKKQSGKEGTPAQ